MKYQTYRYQLTQLCLSLCDCLCVCPERLIYEHAAVPEVCFRLGPHESEGEGQRHGLTVVIKTSWWFFSHQRSHERVKFRHLITEAPDSVEYMGKKQIFYQLSGLYLFIIHDCSGEIFVFCFPRGFSSSVTVCKLKWRPNCQK